MATFLVAEIGVAEGGMLSMPGLIDDGVSATKRWEWATGGAGVVCMQVPTQYFPVDIRQARIMFRRAIGDQRSYGPISHQGKWVLESQPKEQP